MNTEGTKLYQEIRSTLPLQGRFNYTNTNHWIL